MEVKIINKSHHPLPGYATPLSAGMDIRANLTEPVVSVFTPATWTGPSATAWMMV